MRPLRASLLFSFLAIVPGAARGQGTPSGADAPPADPALACMSGGPKLSVANADGMNQAAIYSGPQFGFLNNPSWSPDGQHIAFTQTYPNPGNHLWRIDVVVVNGVPQGTNPTLLATPTDCNGGTNGASCFAPAWSPLGNEIVVGGGNGGPQPRLFVVPSSGGSLTPLYTAPAGYSLLWSTWRADGSTIAFLEEDLADVRSVRLLDRATGSVATAFVFPAGSCARFLDWARTQDKLAVSDVPCAGGAPEKVYVLDLGSGSLTYVTDGRDPTWAPDDSKLAFLDTQGKVKSITLATGAVKTLVKKSGNQNPDWRRF